MNILMKCHYRARLETRTKESNMAESIRVNKTLVQNESKIGEGRTNNLAPLSPSDLFDDWVIWINHVGTRKRVNYT